MQKRKLQLLILSFLMIINMISPVFANYSEGTAGVELINEITGEVGQYTVVNLRMSGSDVITDVPAIYYTKNYETRTLVPISFITNQLGIKSSWKGETNEVTLQSEDTTIVLQIGNPQATVNGVVQDLPSRIAPMLMSYDGKARTMVPVAFITEILGLDVDWDGDTDTVSINKPEQTISNVYLNYKSRFPEIRFKTTGEVDVNSYKVNGTQVGAKDKIFIDFLNTNFDLSDQIQNQDSFDKLTMNEDGSAQLNIGGSLFGIESVNIDQIDDKPSKTRIEITLLDPKGYDVYYDSNTQEMVIQFINTVDKISSERIYNSDAIIIETSEYPAYNKIYEDGKLIIDVINSKFKFNNGEAATELLNTEYIASVNYRSINGDPLYGSDSLVNRVEIQMHEGVEEEDIFTEVIGESIFIYVATEPLIGYDYQKGSNTSSVMTFSMLKGSDYAVNYNEAKRELVVSIDKDLINLQPMSLDYDDNVIKNVSVEQKGDAYKIYVTLEEGTTYVDLTDPNISSAVRFSFANYEIINSKNQNIIIVVDPGHGGKDPGALGSISTEKEINLKAGLMLRKDLEKKGYKVYMTRDTDKYVGLYEIADIANALNADYFISIHNNASINKKAKGVEILHGTTSESGSYGIAREIQNLIPNYLNAYDRGTSLRPELAVLRRTKMPAVLCELGFMTNKEEEALLNTDEYLQRAVDAIVDGFENYLEKYH